MANSRKRENFFERSAWVLFLIGVIEILFGVTDMISGIENDPAILVSAAGMTPAELKAQAPVLYRAMDHQQKVIGNVLLVTGVLLSAISLTAFRRGARWTWFTFWIIAADMVFTAISQYLIRQPGESLAPPFYSGLLFGILTILWLALSYRKYSPEAAESKESSYPAGNVS